VNSVVGAFRPVALGPPFFRSCPFPDVSCLRRAGVQAVLRGINAAAVALVAAADSRRDQRLWRLGHRDTRHIIPHAIPRTTKLYDRTGDDITLADGERSAI